MMIVYAQDEIYASSDIDLRGFLLLLQQQLTILQLHKNAWRRRLKGKY